MKRTTLVLGLVVAFCTTARAEKPSPAKGSAHEMTCGQMMAAKAALPKKLAELMMEVTEGLEAHAKVMMTAKKDAIARAEAKALLKIARAQKALGQKAAKLAADMEALKDLPSSPEAEKTVDMTKMSEMAEKQLRLQREFGKMLLDDAQQAEKMLKMHKSKK